MNESVTLRRLFLFFSILSLMVQTTNIKALSVLFNVDLDAHVQDLQEGIAEKINKIIADELLSITKKKRVTYTLPVFKIQIQPHITVLYDRTVSEKYEGVAVIALQLMQSLQRGSSLQGSIVLVPDADLFGFHNEFFVMKVEDSTQSLHKLRNDVIASLSWLNRYACDPTYDDKGWLNPLYRFGSWIKSFFIPMPQPRMLFDVSRWDAYPFAPHITLGTLPRQEIFRIASWNKVDGKQVWEKIKNRIRLEVIPFVKKTNITQALALTTFFVSSKTYTPLHEFPCEHRANDEKLETVVDTM